MSEQEFVQKLLSEKASQEILRSLGLTDMPHDVQAEALDTIGDSIGEAVYLAIGMQVPEDAREEYQKLVKDGDPVAMKEFLEPYIDDLDAVVREASERELEAVMQRLREQVAKLG